MQPSRFQRAAIIAFLVLIITASLISGVFAAGTRETIITSFSFTCSSVEFSYFSNASGGLDFAIVTVTNINTKEVLYTSDSEFSPWEGEEVINFKPQPAGSELQLAVETADVATVSAPCSAAVPTATPTTPAPTRIAPSTPEPTPVASDGRFCYGAGAAPVAMYAVNGGLDIYQINANDEGVLVIRITRAELDALPANPAQNLEIASVNGISFYKLTDGQYQVNVGPLADGKVHSCVFGDIPDKTPVLNSYNVYGN